MPIPGVPTLEPVPQPMMSPGQAGRSGAAVEQLGMVGAETAYEGLRLEVHIRRAQEHVDSLAARNELDAAYTAMQTDLAKTQNSRDIPDVLKQGESMLNDISNRWSNSPAAVQIQMDADSLRPGMNHIAQMRQIDLMGKEFKVSLEHQGTILAQDYASARNAGDQKRADAALNGYTQAVEGGVRTGLIGTVEADETVRQFRIAGQSLQAQQGIESLDPATNEKMVNQLTSHPEDFPDLTKEQINDLINKGNSAFISHTKQKEWADQQLVKQVVVPQIIKNNTDKESGIFSLPNALKEASNLPPEQERIAAEELNGHAANADAVLLDQFNKADDQIQNAISRNDFNGARQITDALRLKAEQAGLPWYAQQTKVIDAARRQQESEYRAWWHFDEAERRQKERGLSDALSANLVGQITSGRVTQQMLNEMVGEGPGKISYGNWTKLSRLLGQVQKEPDTMAALSVLYDSLPAPPKTASPDEQAQYDMMKWNLYDQWSQGVAEKGLKGQDKTKYAIELVKPFVQKDVADKLDNLLNPKAGKSGLKFTPKWWGDWILPLSSAFTSQSITQKDVQQATQPSAPKEGDTRKNSAGDTIVYKGGRWQLQ